MAGLAGSITPAKSGRIRFDVVANGRNNTAGSGCLIQIRYGTGTAPSNGAALAGVAPSGAAPQWISVTGAAIGPMPTVSVATGLALQTAYWFDLTQRAITSGTCTLSNVDLWASEF